MTPNLSLASAGDDIKLWNCDGFILEKQFNPHSSNIASICWSHDNSVLTSASTAGDKIVMTYPNKSAFNYSVAENEKVNCIAFNSTSRYIMGGNAAGIVHIWDLKSKTLKKTYQDHKGAITALQFNWNDSVIASGSETGEILLYNVVSGVASSPLVGAKSQAVRRLQYSHFKKSLLGSCSDSGGVFLWDANKRQLINSFTTSHMAPVTSLAFSPLNEMLLMSVGLDKRIVCYDVQGKRAVQTMQTDSPLTSVDLLHDGFTLAVGSTRGKISIFDLRKGAEPLRTVPAHKSSIQGLCFQKNTSKSADENLHKQIPASNRKTNLLTNNSSLKNASPKVNGAYTEVSIDMPAHKDSHQLLHTSPASLQAFHVQQQNGQEVFSPIRETLTPKSPMFLDGSGDARHSSGGKNSSINNYADGMFSPVGDKSPLGSKSGKASLSLSPAIRQPPIGGVASSYSPYGDSGAAHTLLVHETIPSDDFPTNHVSSVTTESDSQSENTNEDLTPPDQYKTAHAPPPSRLPAPLSPPRATDSKYGPSPVPQHRRNVLSSKHQTTEPLVTPPDAAPSQGVAAMGGHGDATLQPFHTEFIRSVVYEALDDFRDQVRQDVLNLHMEMLKQFQIQQEEMRVMLKQYSVNGELLAEVERLREENRRLKKTY